MTEPLAEVETVPGTDGPVVRLHGEVDMANVDDIGDRLRAAADPSGTADLDLTAVTFFDSSALRMLHKLSDEFDHAGGRLTVVVAPTGIVGRLIALTHMDAYLHLREKPDPGA
jgi:anti-anti-sigma factor